MLELIKLPILTPAVKTLSCFDTRVWADLQLHVVVQQISSCKIIIILYYS